MYRTLLGILSVFAVALVLVGLTFSSAAEERADYVFVNNTEPKTLDPGKMTGQPEGRIADALFEGLTYRHPKTILPTPGSAESWTVSPDGLRYTFRIRPTARWSNGDPVRAGDFVYSWRRFLDPKTAAEYAYLIHCIRHAEAFNTYAGQVELLRGKPGDKDAAKRDGIIRGLHALVDRQGGTLPMSAWTEFVEERDLRGVLIRPREAAVVAALARDEGDFSAAETSALLAGMESEAKRRAAEHAEAVAHLGVDQGFWAPDDRTFEVELRAFTPYFLDLTAFYPIYAVHPPTVQRWPEDWFVPSKIVSNGPFLMDRWVVNQKIRLKKNPGYWGADGVSLETVDVLALENRTTALNLYLTGEADWLPTAYPPDLVDVLSTRPDWYANQGLVVYYYRINCTKPYLKDRRVREALFLGFDRTVLVKHVTRKGETPATTFVPPGIPGYGPPPSGSGMDVERARRLLAEAGYPNGKGFPKIGILFNTDESHRKIAEYVADQYRKNLGIDCNAYNEEWQSYQESTRRLTYDIARAGWIGDYEDPNTFLDMWLTKGGNNQTGWGSPFYDRLIELASDIRPFLAAPDAVLGRLKDPDRMRGFLAEHAEAGTAEARLQAAARVRFQLFREAEAMLVRDEFPVIPVYFYVVTGLVRTKESSPNRWIDGFYTTLQMPDGTQRPNLQDLHPFRDVRIRSGR
jgi:oligopeptide transport system substrate-binding protein